jgi:hypothetical protein
MFGQTAPRVPELSPERRAEYFRLHLWECHHAGVAEGRTLRELSQIHLACEAAEEELSQREGTA